MTTLYSHPTNIVFFVCGILVVLLAVFQRPVMRFLRMRPPSELYTIPRLQRSARITEKISRVMMVLLGVTFIIQGGGPQFLAPETVFALCVALISLVGLLILGMLGVMLVHWKA
jgi:hypothetical protein